MSNEIYEQLADALNHLPNGFPRTSSNTEISILKWIFSPDEANLACHLTLKLELVEVIAERAGLSSEEASKRFQKMAKRGLIWSSKKENTIRYRLAPFLVGIYEAQLDSIDHDLSHLFEKYMAEGGAQGIMQPEPAIHRVIPAQRAVKSEWILPYDDVRSLLLEAKFFQVRDCICRVQQNYVGRKCDFPVQVCLTFSSKELSSHQSPRIKNISQDEALTILDQTEDVGLVHTVSNVMKGISYICNCCSCCCGILRGISDFGINNSVAYANYYAEIDSELCIGCGICIDRCQVNAISDQNDVSIVDRDRCIGCGLCVTGCPEDAAKLWRKHGSEIVTPPENFLTWEHERLRNRGLLDQ